MWLLIAEMLLALVIIVFIFWWTLKARVDHPKAPGQGEKKLAEDEQTKP